MLAHYTIPFSIIPESSGKCRVCLFCKGSGKPELFFTDPCELEPHTPGDDYSNRGVKDSLGANYKESESGHPNRMTSSLYDLWQCMLPQIPVSLKSPEDKVQSAVINSIKYISSPYFQNPWSDNTTASVGVSSEGEIRLFLGDAFELGLDNGHINEAAYPNGGLLAKDRYSLWLSMFERHIPKKYSDFDDE